MARGAGLDPMGTGVDKKSSVRIGRHLDPIELQVQVRRGRIPQQNDADLGLGLAAQGLGLFALRLLQRAQLLGQQPVQDRHRGHRLARAAQRDGQVEGRADLGDLLQRLAEQVPGLGKSPGREGVAALVEPAAGQGLVLTRDRRRGREQEQQEGHLHQPHIGTPLVGGLLLRGLRLFLRVVLGSGASLLGGVSPLASAGEGSAGSGSIVDSTTVFAGVTTGPGELGSGHTK
jgi:hypothetical protein